MAQSRPSSGVDKAASEFAHQQMKKVNEIKATFDEIKPQFLKLKADIIAECKKIVLILEDPKAITTEAITDSINIWETKINRCIEIKNELDHLVNETLKILYLNIVSAEADKLRSQIAALDEAHDTIIKTAIANTIEDIASIQFFKKNPGAKAIALTLLKPLNEALEKGEVDIKKYRENVTDITGEAVRLFIAQTPTGKIQGYDDQKSEAPKKKDVTADISQIIKNSDGSFEKPVTYNEELATCNQAAANLHETINAFLQQQKMQALIEHSKSNIIKYRATVEKAKKAVSTERSKTVSATPLAQQNPNTLPTVIGIFAQQPKPQMNSPKPQINPPSPPHNPVPTASRIQVAG